MQKAVFMDRDGTLIFDKNYLADPGQVEWIPGTLEALKKLSAAGFLLYIVSNQSGLARGYFGEKELETVNGRIKKDLREAGVSVEGIFYCPYHPEAKVEKYRRDSELRKPGPGLLKKASSGEDINFSKSYMIGDKISDLKAGRKMGCRMVLVKTGKGEEEEKRLAAENLDPDLIAANFPEAVKEILAGKK